MYKPPEQIEFLFEVTGNVRVYAKFDRNGNLGIDDIELEFPTKDEILEKHNDEMIKEAWENR